MKRGLWAKEVAEIFIVCYMEKWDGGNSLPTKIGGDFLNSEWP